MGLLTNDMWRGYPTMDQLLPGGTQPYLPNLLNQPMGKFSQLAYQLAGSPSQKPGPGKLLAGGAPVSADDNSKNLLTPKVGAGLLGVAGITGGLSKALGGTGSAPVSNQVAGDGLAPITPSVSKITEPGVSNLVSSPRTALGAAGDAYGIYQGLQQGGTQGYGSAAAAGANLAGLAGYGGTTASGIGAAGNLASGNYVGAAKNLASLYGGLAGTSAASLGITGASQAAALTNAGLLGAYATPTIDATIAGASGIGAGAGTAASAGGAAGGSGAAAGLGGALGAASSIAGAAGVVLAVAPYLKKGFDGGATTLRNDSQWLKDTGAQQITLARGLQAVKLPDGRLLNGDAVKNLSDLYWRAAFEGGDAQKYYDALANVQAMSGNYNPNAKAIVAADTSKGNIYGRLPGKP